MMKCKHTKRKGEGSNALIATIEIAWPDQKIGYMTVEQLIDKEKLEKDGWRIVDQLTLSEAAEALWGNRK